VLSGVVTEAESSPVSDAVGTAFDVDDRRSAEGQAHQQTADTDQCTTLWEPTSTVM